MDGQRPHPRAQVHRMTPPPTNLDNARWNCPTCKQVWIWRRPPRPTAQWIRLDTTTGAA